MSGLSETFNSSGSPYWNDTEESYKCIPEENEELSIIVVLVFSALTMPIHLFVFMAILFHRSVIRRNVVNVYAGNVIFSSLFSNVWRFIMSGEFFYFKDKIEFVNVTEHPEAFLPDDWKIFRVVFELIMILVTSGSILLVIDAMRSIQFRVHRTVGGMAVHGSEGSLRKCDKNKKLSLLKRIGLSHRQHPRRWASVYILCVWAFPLILTAISSKFNSCHIACFCEHEHKPDPPLIDVENCITTTEGACASVIQPISRVSLNIGFALWLSYVIILTLSLSKTYNDLRALKKQRRKESKKLSNEERNELNSMYSGSSRKNTVNAENTEEDNTKPPEVGVKHAEEPARTNSGENLDIKVNITDTNKKPTVAYKSGSIFLQGLHENFKLLLLMYAAYVIGTSPLAVVALLDGVGNESIHDAMEKAFVVLRILPIISETVCTIMLCMYLSGVKSATRSLAVKLGSCKE